MLCSALARRACTQIDGSVLEGGGQILRMSIAYSAILGIPVGIQRIRAGRKKPGLAAQHLTSLKLARQISQGHLEDSTLGSESVVFTPGHLTPGRFQADTRTAGSVTLMVQAALFPMLFAGGRSTCTLFGGTDVPYSPPWNFLVGVLQPALEQMGANFSAVCCKRGVFPKGGGHVQLEVESLKNPLSPIDLSQQGELLSVVATMHITRPLGKEQCANAIAALHQGLRGLCPSVLVETAVSSGAGGKHMYWIDVIVRTTADATFHRSSLPQSLPGGSDCSKRLTEAVSSAGRDIARSLLVDLKSGAAVGEFLLDQLILPAALACGQSRFLAHEVSLHTRTAIHITEQLLPGVCIKEHRCGDLTLLEIDGIGHSDL